MTNKELTELKEIADGKRPEKSLKEVNTACYKTGLYYFEQNNSNDAIFYLRKAASDSDAITEAVFLLGKILYDGKGDTKDGEKYIKKAADKGHKEASQKYDEICNAKIMSGKDPYQKAELLEKQGQIDEAVKELKKAAATGGYEAQLKLADIFYGKKDFARAKEYAQAALNNPNKANNKAETLLKDIEFDELKDAAGKNDRKAQYKLAQIYLENPNKRDKRKYFDWLKRAADNEDREAQYEIGMLYLKGDDELSQNKDEAEGFAYLSKSAENGFVDAMFECGRISREQNMESKAKLWLKRAADKGHRGAKNLLNGMENTDTPQEMPSSNNRAKKAAKIFFFICLLLLSSFCVYVLASDKDWTHLYLFAVIDVFLFWFSKKFFDDFEDGGNIWANLILGLGTFGTFLGILLAMWEFKEVNDAAIKNMLQSLRFVFMTSILGIGVSISLRVLHSKLYEANINHDKYLNKVLNSIDNISYSISSIKDDWQKQTIEAIDKTFEHLGGIIETKLNQSLGNNFKKFDESMGKLIEYEKNHLSFISGIDRQQEYISNIIESQSALQTEQQKLNDALKLSLQQIFSDIEESRASAQKERQNIDDSFKAALQQIFSDIEKIVSKSGGIFSNYEESLKQIQEKFSNFLQPFRHILDSAQDSFQLQVKEIELLRQNIEQVKDIKLDISSAFNAMHIKELDDALKRQLDSYLRELYKNTLSQINGNYEKIFQGFASNTEEISKKIKDIISKQNKEFLNAVEGVFNLGAAKAMEKLQEKNREDKRNDI